MVKGAYQHAQVPVCYFLDWWPWAGYVSSSGLVSPSLEWRYSPDLLQRGCENSTGMHRQLLAQCLAQSESSVSAGPSFMR